jgi:hypothetical protein
MNSPTSCAANERISGSELREYLLGQAGTDDGKSESGLRIKKSAGVQPIFA